MAWKIFQNKESKWRESPRRNLEIWESGNLGIWEYISQTNNNLDLIEDDLGFKFVDDASVIESTYLVLGWHSITSSIR